MLLRGLDGYAGEFGHTRVAGAGGVDTAGLGGTLEASVTRAALLKALRLRTADAEEFERALLASTSPAVKAEVERQLDVLGIALSSAINVFNPELIILGGFLGPLYDVDPGRLQSVVARETLPALWQGVRITRPQLGSNILMVGAAELAFEEVLRNPASMAPATAN
jgi:predicted NBD/HSP70 family sugar kinase